MRLGCFRYLLALFSCIITLFFCACGDRATGGYEATESTERELEAKRELFPFTFDAARLTQIGPQACAECHLDEVNDWKKSHHALANRPIDLDRDMAAFTPSREIDESGVTYRLEFVDGKFWLKVIHSSAEDDRYELVGVIGETPIRQYLTKIDGNRFQTISASYDVINDRWLDVFAGEDRQPGEWGHWLEQGMNWNANCAYCHMTEYSKDFDFEGSSYHSTWVQQGIACAECHTGLEDHLRDAKSGVFTSLPRLDREQTMENCATCHSRRDQLTADAFQPGDRYHDHFSLTLPDQPGLYYPDGQILDEVFVYGSFEMSRMAHAGVTCMDCHNPHSLEHTLPVENNMLCLRCHEGGHMNAPIIEPAAHSHHPQGSRGNSCVECHMPQTTYMQVDARADHGFHSPDPLMTKELGIPNACSSCHQNETIDWAVKHAENWYGEALSKSRQRQRTRAISAAYDYDPKSIDALMSLLKTEEIPAWRATYIGILRNFVPNQRVVQTIQPFLTDSEAIVRERSVLALAQAGPLTQFSIDILDDGSRSVRLATARAHTIRGEAIVNPFSEQEWRAYLDFHSDRPQNLFFLADEAAQRGESDQTKQFIERAISLDEKNAQVYQQSAIILSKAGMVEEARAKLLIGWELQPADANFPYSLGLLAAEAGSMAPAIGYLEEAVAMSPQFYRAWYNLSLAYSKTGQPEKARHAMRKAQGNE